MTTTISSTWPDGTFATATFSDDMLHRYLLTVTLQRDLLAPHAGFVVFIGLNPSTATHEISDATMRRCLGFTRRFGFNSFYMLNLFSFRATDPKVMMRAGIDVEGDPVNIETILSVAAEASIVICAWGGMGCYRLRDDYVTRALREQESAKMRCLGRNGDGSPRHPLYLRNNTKLRPFTGLGLVGGTEGA